MSVGDKLTRMSCGVVKVQTRDKTTFELSTFFERRAMDFAHNECLKSNQNTTVVYYHLGRILWIGGCCILGAKDERLFSPPGFEMDYGLQTAKG